MRAVWKEGSDYLPHGDDADLEAGVCVDVEGVRAVSVHDAVLHLGVDALVQVLGEHSAHGGAHRRRFQHAHLVVLWEERAEHAPCSCRCTAGPVSSTSHRDAVQNIFLLVQQYSVSLTDEN